MDGERRFTIRNLFGFVAIIAVALGLTRYLLSLLPSPDLYPLPAICFLFVESATAVYCWFIFVRDLISQSKSKDRWQNLGLAVFTLLLLLITFSMLLPA